MFHYKLKEQSFIIPALIILLCLVCLVGSTFALFTGDPNKGTIGIITTSGNVKIDIVDTSEEGNTLVGSVLQFQTSADQADVLFEPGVTFYTQGFRVKNEGSIPVNFHLTVSEVLGNDKAAFNQAFELWITKNHTDPTEAVRLTDFVGHLAPNTIGEDVYYLFVKMKKMEH